MPDRPEEEARAAAVETRESPRPADVGGKVNAIIEAAEAAAKEIGQDARKEALEIVRQAEKEAAALIEELTRDAAQAKVEADQYARDIREAADSYGSQHRRSAEEEALRLVAEAEAKARVTLKAAQQSAEETERDTVQRHQTLQREAKMLEERRQRVLESLRDLAAQLQDALVEPAEMARQDESLVDALDVDAPLSRSGATLKELAASGRPSSRGADGADRGRLRGQHATCRAHPRKRDSARSPRRSPASSPRYTSGSGRSTTARSSRLETGESVELLVDGLCPRRPWWWPLRRSALLIGTCEPLEPELERLVADREREPCPAGAA